MKKRFVKTLGLVKLLTITAALAMIVSLNSCEQYEILPEEVVEEVTFTEVQAIFTSSCVGCHDGVTASPDLQDGQAYNNLVSGSYLNTDTPEESTLYVKMKSSSHSIYSSSTDRSRVLNWIENGALNN